jgi:hypothetical protein
VAFSHMAHSPTLPTSSFAGWKAIRDDTKTGRTSGAMAVLPSYAATAFGAPVFAMNPAASILARLGWGPAISVFDPVLITGTSNGTIAGTELLYYDHDEFSGAIIGDDGGGEDYFNPNDINLKWNAATQITGIVVPDGYRTALVFGRHGIGDYCYGTGTATEALHNTDNGAGFPFCYDPTGVGTQGNHAYPYRYQVWAYDLNHLLEVKNGTRSAWDVQPYDYGALTGIPLTPTADQGWMLGQASYDPAGKRIFIPQMGLNGAFSLSAVVWVVTHP